MTSYPLVPLTSLCDVLSGGTPKTTNSDYWNGDIPWASVKDFNKPSRWFGKTEKSITRLGLESCSTALLEPGDLILSARGTVGVIAQCKVATAFNQSNYGLKARPDRAINDYLYYALLAANKSIQADTHGGAFDTITRATLDRLLVPAPSLETQVVISKTLGLLDEKIELNTLISTALERLAQNVFKSWFVDFDPVHAKARGEQPEGMDAETAALFPDSFEESELGLIPRGWSVTALTEISEFINGLALQKYPALDGEENLPVIKIPQLKTGIAEGSGCASSTIPSKYVVDDGDILFSWSGALEVALWAGGKGALNQHLFKVVPKSFPIWFSLHTTLMHLPEFREIAASKATTMGHIQRGHLAQAKCAVPNAMLRQKASEVLQPLLDASVAHRVQNRTLVKVRDSLLPKLISGAVVIPEELLVD